MIIERLTEFPYEPVFARVSALFDHRVNVLLKLEGFNAGGSIKLKPALSLVNDLRARNVLRPDSVIIDTTSGNMGIALAMIARSLGHGFVCVSDEKMTLHNRRLVRAYGAEVVILEGSNLDDRYAYILERLAVDSRLVWTRQFRNEMNPTAHEGITAREILDSIPCVDHLFVGTGTGGTLAGCAKVFARESSSTTITAVDALGSKHFDDSATLVPRKIPGIGATQRSPFLDGVHVHRVMIISDDSAIEHCKMLRDRTGWLLGGSSGSVLSAIMASAEQFRDGDTVVGICADFGERYLDSVYADEAPIELLQTAVLTA